MNELVSKFEEIIRKAGDIVLNADESKMEIDSKAGIGNFVTYYDTKVQEFLKTELLKVLPEGNFVGEEEELHSEIKEKGYTFIVDPIDGTANFTKRFQTSAVSIALLKDAEPYIGVCFNPYKNELFKAEKGKGAYLNGEQIHVSEKMMKDALVMSGSAPYYPELREKSLQAFSCFFKACADYRRFGAAVLDLCYVAAGKAELFYEVILQPWDYAAGMLVVTEAGGKVTDMEGNKIRFDKPCSILASNNKEDYLKYLE